MQTGIFDRTRLAANILMVVLVALNIFFSIQYTSSLNRDDQRIEAEASKTEERLQTAKFMKLFVDKVLGSNGTISFDDRIKLENDVVQLGDENIKRQWEAFVNSESSEDAQKTAVILMSLLSDRMVK